MKGIDCSTPINKEIAQSLVDQGIFYVARYLVPDLPDMTWKRLTREEVQILTDAGIKILSIFETSPSRACFGKPAGEHDGQFAFNETQVIGQPSGTCVFFAVDYEAEPEDYDAIEAYLKAAAEQLPGYHIGVYGSYYVTEEMANRKACQAFWQTYAWSNGNLSEIGRDVYQYENGVQLAGIEVDLDDFYYESKDGFKIVWNYNDVIQEIPVSTEPDYKAILFDIYTKLKLIFG
jgi:hypothetical protein